MPLIAHVDADCFYVSCERIRDRRLVGKPVGVLGNQGACVIARSYEMKEEGVKVAMPVWKAKELCPDGIYIKRDFQWYGVVSDALQQILRSLSPVVEYYSVDESFADLTDLSVDPFLFALKLQKRMLEEVGVPVSIGLGPTRTLAKIGSDRNKPFGITVVTEKNLGRFLETTDIGEIPGIGRRLGARLAVQGVKTAADFVGLDHFFVKQLIHKPGEELWYELRGKSILPIRNVRPCHKSISRGGSIWGHYSDPKYIWGFITRNIERFLDALWKNNLEVNNVTLVLVGSTGFSRVSKLPLPDYTNSYELIARTLRVCFEQSFLPGYDYCRVHIVSDAPRPVQEKQLSLFEVESERSKKIKALKKTLNEKFGLFAVRMGASSACPKVFRDKISDFEICDIEGKFCF